MHYRLGVDIGGTFTDFALLDEHTGNVRIHKQLTTPADPSLAVLDGIDRLSARERVPVSEIASLSHGTTLVTNAIIERKGAATGMLVTAGFRDLLDIGLEMRYDLFDLRINFPAPLVPRAARAEISERILFDGSVERALDEEKVRSLIAGLIEARGIEALAVCFLHAHANPAHEDAVRRLCAEEFPALYVSGSADVVPNMREYERWTTATANAYTQPMFDRYLGRLADGLAARGFSGSLLVMTSSGGVVGPDAARRYPVRVLQSGPAAGVLMTAHHGRTLGARDLISFDMGGTTAKGALVREGRALKAYQMEVARIHEFKRGSGLPIKVPTIDLLEIGSGGGGIAGIDARGLIRVGPASAGADPGPACYGRGGRDACLTDANLMLGYLDPGFFLGGEMALDEGAARDALARAIGAPLGLAVERAAWGIHEVINEDVARAFRIHCSERGFDYRSAPLVAFGGSGPMHALRIARKLRIGRVVFPAAAGVMSAFGLLVSPLAFDISRSHPVPLAGLDACAFAEVFRPLTETALGFLREAGAPESAIRTACRLDMRFEGQGYEIEVALPEADDLGFAELPALFREAYAARYAASGLDEPLELVTWKVEASVEGTAPSLELAVEAAAGDALKGTRRAYFEAADAYVPCPVYDRYKLGPGAEIEGPALIEERESTCVVDAGWGVKLDAHGNLIADRKADQ